MELEQLRNDLITIINHYGKTIPIGPIFYVVKDVAREVTDIYNNWMDKQAKESAEPAPTPEPEPAEPITGEVEE